MNIFTRIHAKVIKALQSLQSTGQLPEDLDFSRLVVEPPRDPSHGDMACNAAMALAKSAGLAPRALAEKLVPLLEADDDINQVTIAGPGFINMTLNSSLWPEVLARLLEKGFDFGKPDQISPKKIMVEFVSANPTGPLHGGHVRGAVFGDALASLLSYAGHDVTREFYVNDDGGQIKVLVSSVFLRYKEACGEVIEAIPAGLYPGDYLIPIAQALAEQYGDKLKSMPDSERFAIIRRFTIDAILETIRHDLADLGIVMDHYASEYALKHGEEDKVASALAELDKQGHLYYGQLPPPKGQIDEDWEEREQWLFRSTNFGDSQDRALKKSDGSYTYFANDVAYHADKIARGYNELINVLGADHSGYVSRVKAAVSAISAGAVNLDVKICQIVHLLRDGEVVKMSKRSGDFLTLEDIIAEVGKDVVRFFMLTRSNDSQLDFDFVKVLEKSKDNPVFYVHYAHARTCSVLRQAEEQGLTSDPAAAISKPEYLASLNDPDEIILIKKLASFPRLITQAVEKAEPHRLAFFAGEIAALYHALWNKGKDEKSLRFIQHDDLSLTYARLCLNQAVREILASCLKLLGIKPVEELH